MINTRWVYRFDQFVPGVVLTMTNMIQLCSEFHQSQVFIMNTRPDEIRVRAKNEHLNILQACFPGSQGQNLALTSARYRAVESSSGSNIIPRWARSGLAGLRPHTCLRTNTPCVLGRRPGPGVDSLIRQQMPFPRPRRGNGVRCPFGPFGLE